MYHPAATGNPRRYPPSRRDSRDRACWFCANKETHITRSQSEMVVVHLHSWFAHTLCISVVHLKHYSEKGSIAFTRMPTESMAQKGLRTLALEHAWKMMTVRRRETKCQFCEAGIASQVTALFLCVSERPLRGAPRVR